MRWLLLLSLVLPSIALAGLAGFDNLQWGMTRQDVEKAYYNFEEWTFIGFDESGKEVPKQAYGLQDHSVAGCSFELRLDFFDNKLYRATLAQRFDDKNDCNARIKQLLTQSYGVAQSSRDAGKSIQWSAPGTAIFLKTYVLSAGKLHTEIVYVSKKVVDDVLHPSKL